MRPPDEVLREILGQWIHKAEIDYCAAQQLLEANDLLREAIAFHCQPAAEKYLKAFLVRHQVEPLRTHNLGKLLDQIAGVSPQLAISLADAVDLSPYGVDVRYPGDFPDVLVGAEKPLFDLARQVREAVMAELNPFLHASPPAL
jgi:HEPN domain-containing protein